MTWATENNESAAILVLVAGEKEMEKVAAECSAFSKRHHLECEHRFQVDSTTPKKVRTGIRNHLEEQNFRIDQPSTLVLATSVFAKSITLYINGLVDTNMVVALDSNTFLNLYRCTAAQTIQRKGRAGRVHQTMYKQLRSPEKALEQDLTSEYVMPKKDAMSLTLGLVRLEEEFTIIGLPDDFRDRCFKELQGLGLISDKRSGKSSYSLTTFGQEVFEHSVDVHVGIIPAVCARFDLLWHGRIAAAFLQDKQRSLLSPQRHRINVWSPSSTNCRWNANDHSLESADRDLHLPPARG